MCARSEDAEPRSRPKWRWFRFSLRTLLVATTLLSLAFGFVFNGVQNERRAAKAVGEAGGEIVYDWQVFPPGSDLNVQPVPPGPQWLRKCLGPHWFDRIVEVRLNGYVNQGSKSRFAAVSAHLVKLPFLRSLSLWGGELDDSDYRALGELKQLKSLFLRQKSEIRPQDTASIARLTGLRELNLSDVKISPEALHELAKLPHLDSLSIDCFYHDPNDGGRQTKYQLRDEAAEALAGFPALRSLSLHMTLITDEGMAALSKLSRLETLVVSSPNVTSASFDHVAKLKHLKLLGAWQWKIDDAHFEKLSQLPELTWLGLQTRLTDRSVAYLAQLDRIERLTLTGKGITDASVPHLCRLSKLEWLDISGTGIAKHGTGAKMLRLAFPKCRVHLPKTDKEIEMERAFHNMKWGGGV